MLTQSKSKRTETGARYHASEGKRKYSLARKSTLTKLAKTTKKKLRGKSGHMKVKLLTADIANVFDPKEKKYIKAKIITIKESASNRHYVRRNIMTRGAIIETDKGLAKITSRPGQEGTVNAVLI